MCTRRQFVLGSLALAANAHAQQLAHAGWRGNGIAAESWWKHASFLRFAPDTTFTAALQSLDSMAQVSLDTIILPDLQPTTTAPFSDRFGSEDDLDSFLREAAARRMHVLLRLPLQRAIANPGEVHFWMNRGIAGLDVGTLGSGDMDAARQLRSSLDHFRGERILMARTPGLPAATTAKNRRTPRDPITLHILSPDDLAAGTAHPSLTTPVEIPGLPAHDEPQTAATVPLPAAVPRLGALLPLLLTPGAPILDSRLLDSPRDRASLHDILAFRSTHPLLRTGDVRTVQTAQPTLHAWIIKGTTSRDALLVASNTGTAPLTLHLSAPLSAQGVAGAYLRPLLRSDNAMGAINVEDGALPPGAAILAEIRSDSYAPPSTLDPDAPPPGTGRHTARRRRRR